LAVREMVVREKKMHLLFFKLNADGM
jgi:hypothetical protein